MRYNKNGIPVDERRPAPSAETDFETVMMIKLDNLIDSTLRIASALEKIVERYEKHE